ncbi:cytochrome P450 [Crassisporium funariophilum]|nr:cytochrome P450 [Crassisporium funariophilum]
MAGLLLVLDIILAAFALLLVKKVFGKKLAPFPPGPAKMPLIENLLDMPASQEWFTFAKWGKEWGDIVSVSVFGQQIVILNSVASAIEMLDRKSSIYSDRPLVPMGGELVGWKRTLALLRYGDRFRNYRKLFHRTLGSHTAMSKFLPAEERETRRFLKRVMAKPEDLAAHVRQTAGAIILRISHGYEVKENDDPFVSIADEAVEQFSLTTAPGGFLVNVIPALRHTPSWFPGASFKRKAAIWAKTLDVMAEGPYQFVKQQMALGLAKVSFTSQLLEAPNLTSDEEFDIKWSAASLYSAGADTTVSAIYALFLAMLLYPEATRKAQAEIDAVVGADRLPGFADKDNLPYTNAFALEVLRWHCVTPTGVPHSVIEDNIHEGYLILKGAVIITNIWQMTHDPEVYSDPFTFKPERFLGPNPEQDPRDVCFGFGRRICPGESIHNHIPDPTTQAKYVIPRSTTSGSFSFHFMRHDFGGFDISKYSENGVIVEPIVEQTTGIISHLKPFKCSIQPRSPKAADLVSAYES